MDLSSRLGGTYKYFPLTLDAPPGDSNHLLTGCKGFGEADFVLWDRRAGQVLRQAVGHSQDITCCSFLGRGEKARTFATGSKDGSLKFWSVLEGSSQDPLLHHHLRDGMYTGMSMGSDNLLWTSTLDGSICCYSVVHGGEGSESGDMGLILRGKRTPSTRSSSDPEK